MSATYAPGSRSNFGSCASVSAESWQEPACTVTIAAHDAVQVVESSRTLVVRRRHDLQCGWQLCAGVFKNGNLSAHGQRLGMGAGPPSTITGSHSQLKWFTVLLLPSFFSLQLSPTLFWSGLNIDQG